MTDLRKFESPFEWIDAPDLVLQFDEKQEIKIDIEEQPVLSIMNDIMFVFFRTLQNNICGAEQKLTEVEETWEKLEKGIIQDENVSIKVLSYIIQSTKYHVFEKKDDKSGSEEVLKIIQEFQNLENDFDLSTIDGCKSIAWSIFHDTKCYNAIHNARSATNKNRDCPLWYYLLAKNLRKKRQKDFQLDPIPEEVLSISKCCELSSNFLYRLLRAQILHEQKNYAESMKSYVKVYQINPKSVSAQLQLAWVFIRNKEFVQAKSCLDYVEKYLPQNRMFLYYKGKYVKEKEKNTEEAMEYFKMSSELSNFPADIAYAKCLIELNKILECFQYLHEMLEKYQDNINYKREILLLLAFFAIEHKDFEEAASNFLDAIKLNKKSRQLISFHNELDEQKSGNIFHYIKDTVLPILEESNISNSVNLQQIIEELKKVCKYKRRKNPPPTKVKRDKERALRYLQKLGLKRL